MSLDLTDVETRHGGGSAAAGATAGAFAGSLAAALHATTRELSRTVPIGGAEPPLQPPDEGPTEEPAPADAPHTDAAPADSPSPRRGAPLLAELQYVLGQDPPPVDRLQALARYAAAGPVDARPTPPASAVDAADAAEEHRKRLESWITLAWPAPVLAPQAPLTTPPTTTSPSLTPVAVGSVAASPSAPVLRLAGRSAEAARSAETAAPATSPLVPGPELPSLVAPASPLMVPRTAPVAQSAAATPAGSFDSPTSQPATVAAQPSMTETPAHITDPTGVDPVAPWPSQPAAWLAPAGLPAADLVVTSPGTRIDTGLVEPRTPRPIGPVVVVPDVLPFQAVPPPPVAASPADAPPLAPAPATPVSAAPASAAPASAAAEALSTFAPPVPTSADPQARAAAILEVTTAPAHQPVDGAALQPVAQRYLDRDVMVSGTAPGAVVGVAPTALLAPVFPVPADASPAPPAPSSGSQTVQGSGIPTLAPDASTLMVGAERAADGAPSGPPEQVAARAIADPTSLATMAQQALAAAARAVPTSPATGSLVVSQIAHGIRLASQQLGRSVAFRLQPEGLGSVAVRLSHGASGVSVQILLDSTSTHDLVQAGLPDLARSIAERGITVDQLQVGLASGQLGGGDAGYREARQPVPGLAPPTRAARMWDEPAGADEPILATNRVDYRV
ncbi:MAG: flagellar hook-length control protein FliK [Chloroflexi bacterium]|nr:flagellar hook-length control protein FliK [Chloroflexota bacterium]